MLPLLLASSSAYRRELLARLRLPFTWASPDIDEQRLADEPAVDLVRRLAKPRGSRSLSEHLRREAGVSGVRAALLYEVLDKAALADPTKIAATLKRFPFRLQRTRPIEEAISSAGGIPLEALDQGLMLRGLAGVFAAGEMLDWEAPTGGYLLTACFASGRHAARGVIDWLDEHSA